MTDGKSISWDKSYTFNATMYRDKKTWVKKSLVFSLELLEPNNKTKNLGKGEINLAMYSFDSDKDEKKEVTAQLKLGTTFSHAPANLRVIVESKCLKNEMKPGDDDFSEMTSQKGGPDSDDEGEEQNKRSSSVLSNNPNIENLNRIQELQKKIRELEAIKNPSLPENDRVAIIQQMLDTAQKERDDAKARLKVVEDELDDAKTLSERNSLIAKLSEEKLATLQQRTSELQRNADDAKKMADVLTKEKEVMSKLVTELRQKASNASSNPDLQEEFDELQDENLKLKKQVDETSHDFDELKKKFKKVTVELEETKLDLEDAIAKSNAPLPPLPVIVKTEVKPQTSGSDVETAKLKEKVEDLQRQIGFHHENIDGLKAKNSEFQKKISALEAEKLDLSTKIKKLEASSTPTSKNPQQNEFEKKLNATVEEFKAKTQEFQKEKNNLNAEKEKLADQVSDLERKLINAKEENNLLLTVSQNKGGSTPRGSDDVKKLKETYETQIGELLEKINTLQKPNKNEANLKTENEKLTKKISDLESEISKLSKSPSKKDSKQSTSDQQALALEAQEKIVAQVKQEITGMMKDVSERFMLDTCVLFAQPKYEGDLPSVLKVIYLTIQEWNVFDIKKNPTFCENLLRAFEYIIQRHDSIMSIYWIQVLYRLLDLLKKDYPGIIQKIFIKSQLEDEKNGPIDLEALDATPPDFITSTKGKSRFGKDSDENIFTFSYALHDILKKGYLLLLNNLYSKLDKNLHYAIFELKKENIVNSVTKLSLTSEERMKRVLEDLEEFYEELIAQHVEVNIINHFFECVTEHLDSFVFNNLISEATYTSRGIQIKMSLSFIHNWFEEHNFIFTHKIFSFAREASDVCVIAQKSLLTDEQMRNDLCPHLNVAQISKLLSNYSDDDLDHTRVSPSVLQSLQQDIMEKSFLIRPFVDFYQFVDVQTEENHKFPLFSLELNQNRTKLENMRGLKQFDDKKEFKFLSN